MSAHEAATGRLRELVVDSQNEIAKVEKACEIIEAGDRGSVLYLLGARDWARRLAAQIDRTIAEVNGTTLQPTAGQVLLQQVANDLEKLHAAIGKENDANLLPVYGLTKLVKRLADILVADVP